MDSVLPRDGLSFYQYTSRYPTGTKAPEIKDALARLVKFLLEETSETPICIAIYTLPLYHGPLAAPEPYISCFLRSGNTHMR